MISLRIFCARSIVSALFGRFDRVLVARFQPSHKTIQANLQSIHNKVCKESCIVSNSDTETEKDRLQRVRQREHTHTLHA